MRTIQASRLAFLCISSKLNTRRTGNVFSRNTWIIHAIAHCSRSVQIGEKKEESLCDGGGWWRRHMVIRHWEPPCVFWIFETVNTAGGISVAVHHGYDPARGTSQKVRTSVPSKVQVWLIYKITVRLLLHESHSRKQWLIDHTISFPWKVADNNKFANNRHGAHKQCLMCIACNCRLYINKSRFMFGRFVEWDVHQLQNGRWWQLTFSILMWVWMAAILFK